MAAAQGEANGPLRRLRRQRGWSPIGPAWPTTTDRLLPKFNYCEQCRARTPFYFAWGCFRCFVSGRFNAPRRPYAKRSPSKCISGDRHEHRSRMGTHDRPRSARDRGARIDELFVEAAVSTNRVGPVTLRLPPFRSIPGTARWARSCRQRSRPHLNSRVRSQNQSDRGLSEPQIRLPLQPRRCAAANSRWSCGHGALCRRERGQEGQTRRS